MAKFDVISVTILDDAPRLSAAVALGGAEIVGIEAPATWETAALTFAASITLSGTYVPLYDSDGGELSIAIAAIRMIGLTAEEASILQGLPFIKLRSGTLATPVDQTAEKTLSLIVRRARR